MGTGRKLCCQEAYPELLFFFLICDEVGITSMLSTERFYSMSPAFTFHINSSTWLDYLVHLFLSPVYVSIGSFLILSFYISGNRFGDDNRLAI